MIVICFVNFRAPRPFVILHYFIVRNLHILKHKTDHSFSLAIKPLYFFVPVAFVVSKTKMCLNETYSKWSKTRRCFNAVVFQL
jgi:hypothetical protein